MSARTIKIYQDTYGTAPTQSELIRATAKKLRNYAAGILARAQELEESADALEGKR